MDRCNQTLDNYKHEKYVAILYRHEFDKISPESQKFIKTISSIPYNLNHVHGRS